MAHLLTQLNYGDNKTTQGRSTTFCTASTTIYASYLHEMERWSVSAMDLYTGLSKLYLIWLLLVLKYIIVALFNVICLKLKSGRFKPIFRTLRACFGELHSNFPSSAPRTPCQTCLAPGTPEKKLGVGEQLRESNYWSQFLRQGALIKNSLKHIGADL
jgi:hypothetical protein